MLLFSISCDSQPQNKEEKIRMIIDSDANNELDDQHAIAYALFNGDLFDVEGITVNRTHAGGGIEQQYAEAVRVVKLCDLYPKMRVFKGADGNYEDIVEHINEQKFDGADAVNFIIERAKIQNRSKLLLVPVGKLTNIALAIKKDPSIIPMIKVLWLGTNYPDAGEYNFDNDITAVNAVLDSKVEFEIAVVGYESTTGTASVKASTKEIREIMPGKGPHIKNPVEGRHGGEFSCFGDYSINLFENTNNTHRALYDMAAVAIVKNPSWAIPDTIGAPKFVDGHWVKRSDNIRKIIIWDNFKQKKIMDDFYSIMKNYRLVKGRL
ncbi:MAG: nucleoside hydrolase [Chlorobi bacterium]|nr:nucleoside hydrolase [Chlorobiota bacterium]